MDCGSKSISVDRKPLGDIVAKQADDLAARSKDLAAYCLNKLAPIAALDNSCEVDKPQKDPEYYPPLLDFMRQSLNVIRASLDSIESIVHRTEV